VEALAVALGRSRSTVSRFFSGRPTSRRVTLAILMTVRLELDDIAKLWDPDEATGNAA
jgi:hypothetical protein